MLSPQSSPFVAQALSGHRVPILDGLRGIAILLVVLFHSTFLVPTDPDIASWIKIGRIGWIGVELFFGLSGFLITGILLDSKHLPNAYPTFVARRALRLVPALALLFAILFGVLPRFFAPETIDVPVLSSQMWPQLVFLSNFAVAFVEWPPFTIGMLWSLSLEAQFYLAWPWLVRGVSKKTLLRACLGVFLFTITLRWMLVDFVPGRFSYVFPFCRLDSLALGSAIAVLLRLEVSKDHLRRTAKTILAVTLPAGIGLAASNPFQESALMQRYGYATYALFFASCLTLALFAPSDSRLTRVLSHRTFCFFGKYSYGLYLFHSMIMSLLQHFGVDPGLTSTFWAGAGMQLAFFTSALSISTALAVASYHLLEERFLNPVNHFSRQNAG